MMDLVIFCGLPWWKRKIIDFRRWHTARHQPMTIRLLGK